MLPDFPLKGQLLDTTEVNRFWDCVPTSIAAALQFLTGQDFDGGQIKDLIYGPAYIGGTAARDYVDYCARFRVKLFAVNGGGQALVNEACGQIAKGNPVLFTEPDPYDNPQLYSHVIVACGFDAQNVCCMDPYIQQIVSKSRQEWAAILEFGQVWPLARISLENSGMFTPASGEFARYYKEVDAHHWTCIKNGFVVQLGMKAFYQGLTLDGDTLPLPGLPTGNERQVSINGKTITAQPYERMDLAYDPAHSVDSQPGCKDVYVLKVGALPPA